MNSNVNGFILVESLAIVVKNHRKIIKIYEKKCDIQVNCWDELQSQPKDSFSCNGDERISPKWVHPFQSVSIFNRIQKHDQNRDSKRFSKGQDIIEMNSRAQWGSFSSEYQVNAERSILAPVSRWIPASNGVHSQSLKCPTEHGNFH